MRIVRIILILFILNLNFVYPKESLIDNPIDLTERVNCTLDEFCQKYISDIDIEKFIKQEIENDYVVVSLDECIEVAFKNNFNIEINEHDFQSYKYEYQNALSKFLPLLNTTSYISDYSGQILVGGVLRDTFHETALSVNITAQHDLTQGGRQIFEAKAKKYFSKNKKHELNFSKTKVIYLTTRYYYEMLLAKLNIEIYLRNLIERNAQLALAQNLKNSGFGTQFDVIRSLNESAQAKTQLLNALNEFRLSQSRLANLMGIDVKTALMPFEKDIKPLNLIDENQDLEVFIKEAKEFREDLMAYKDLINYEKQIRNVYLTDFVPKPLISYQQQFQGTLNHSINPNYIVTAFMTWEPGENLIWGTITKLKMQKEKIRVRILEFQNKLREIEQQIIDARSTSIFNKKQVAINEKRLEYSKESIKLAMLRFNNGKGILLDVIQAQSEATQARVNYVSSIIKYNISQVELLYDTGRINTETIIKNYKP